MPLPFKISTPNVHLFRIVKILDIVYIGLLFFIIAGGLTFLINFAVQPVPLQRHRVLVLLEVILLAMVLPIVAYLARIAVKSIPSPFNGVMGLDHKRMKELGGGVIIAFSMQLFFPRILERVRLLQAATTQLQDTMWIEKKPKPVVGSEVQETNSSGQEEHNSGLTSAASKSPKGD
jgi:hypothetical protein